MKKIILVLTSIVLCFYLVGCSSSSNSVIVEGELSDIMADLYEGWVPDDFYLMDSREFSSDDHLYFLGTDEYEILEGYASEPFSGDYAHSIVLVRLDDSVSVSKFKSAVKSNIDKDKWISTGVSSITIDNIGNLVIIIMENEYSDEIHANFLKLND